MRLRKDFPFEELVKFTPGYVGADLQTLIKEASILAVERAVGCIEFSPDNTKAVKAEKAEKDNQDAGESSSDGIDLNVFYIELDDFKKAAKLVKPSA